MPKVTEINPNNVVLGADGRLQVNGEMVFSSVAGLRVQGLKLLTEAGSAEVDLGGVTRTDSAGLSLLLEWLRAGRSAGKPLAFRNVPEQLMVIAALSDLDDLIPVAT